MLFGHSVVSDSVRPHGLQHARPPIGHHLPEFAQVHVRGTGDATSSHLILCCSLFSLSLIFPRIRVFSNESALHIRLPKFWSFSFSMSPSNEYSGLISLRLTGLILMSKGLSRVFSSTTVRRHLFFGPLNNLPLSAQLLFLVKWLITILMRACHLRATTLRGSWPGGQHCEPCLPGQSVLGCHPEFITQRPCAPGQAT